jgi:hypothetical protein
MSTPSLAAPEAVNFETSFHLDSGVEADTYLVIHQLMGRGQLLNAYAVRLSSVFSPKLFRNDAFHQIVADAQLELARARPRVARSGSRARRFL